MRFGRSARNRLPVSACICIAALIASAALADATDPSAAQKYESSADAMVTKGDYKGAIVELKNAKKANPQDGGIRIKLAAVELAVNDLEGAQIELKAARQNGGDEAKIVPLLPRAYLPQAKFEELLQQLPVNDDAPAALRALTLTVRADALAGLNRIEDAKSALAQALILQPDSNAVKLAMARLDSTHGQPDAAEKIVDSVLTAGPSADASYLKGDLLARKGDNAGALAQFNTAIAGDPNNTGAFIERAEIYMTQDEDTKATADIKSALALSPRSVSAGYIQALLLTRAKDYAGADAILTKYSDGFPAFPRGFYLQAVVKTELKQYEQAGKAIDAYLGAAPDDVRGKKVQADIMIKRGDFNSAADILERIAAQNPGDTEAFTMLGQAYATIDPAKSAAALERAAKLAPENASILRGLAFDHVAEGKYSLGSSELEKIVADNPNDSEAAQSLILIYIQQKQYDKARDQIAAEIRKRPDDPVAADATGVLELAQGHIAEAKAAFLAVQKKFPGFIAVNLQMADIDLTEGNLDKARDAYQAILAKNQSNLAALKGLSAVFVKQNQPDQLIDLWRKSYRAVGDNVFVERGLIQAYIFKGDIDGGLSAVRDMQIRQPKEPLLYRERADLELRAGQPKAAIESIKRLIELEPQDIVAQQDLAHLQLKIGDNAAAAATIAAARKLDPANAILGADEVRILGADDPEKGIAAARKLAALLPDQPAAMAVEGDYLQSLNRPADALAAYQNAFKAQPSLFLADVISRAAVTAGQPAVGEKILRDWTQAHPQDAGAQDILAAFLQSEKKFAEAKTLYEALLKDRPNDPGILNNLALIYERDNDPRALDFAKKAYEAAPANADIADTFGWITVQKDATPMGLELLQRAHALEPKDLNIQYHLAYALNRAGKKADAADLLKKAIASGVDFDSRQNAQSLLGELSKG
jgi:putative PEP-CTERM system TPR-repeat lipoprotein